MNYAKEWLEIDRGTMIILILPFLQWRTMIFGHIVYWCLDKRLKSTSANQQEA
jgi:hypothetical protein